MTERQAELIPGNKEINTKFRRLEKGIPIPEMIYQEWVKLGFKDD